MGGVSHFGTHYRSSGITGIVWDTDDWTLYIFYVTVAKSSKDDGGVTQLPVLEFDSRICIPGS